jgi:flagellar motor switch protein FliN/FliY
MSIEEDNNESDGLEGWGDAMAEQAEAEASEGGEQIDPDDLIAEAGAQAAGLDELSDDAPSSNADSKLDTILDIPVTISMEVGRTNISIRNLLQLNQGSVVELDRVAGEPLDVLVNGTLIAHGEVVVINDKFGIRLTDVISQVERIKKLK